MFNYTFIDNSILNIEVLIHLNKIDKDKEGIDISYKTLHKLQYSISVIVRNILKAARSVQKKFDQGC